jgi:DNA-binding HxlR family transcriptional regulator
VLNERLRKLLDYGVINRTEFPGKVLRVEYQLSTTGRKLKGILEQLRDMRNATRPSEVPGGGQSAFAFMPVRHNLGRRCCTARNI